MACVGCNLGRRFQPQLAVESRSSSNNRSGQPSGWCSACVPRFGAEARLVSRQREAGLLPSDAPDRISRARARIKGFPLINFHKRLLLVLHWFQSRNRVMHLHPREDRMTDQNLKEVDVAPSSNTGETPAGSNPEATNSPPSSAKRTRVQRPFPNDSFEDSLTLALAINNMGGSKTGVRRLTLFNQLGKAPESGPSRQLIVNSSKYGLTRGSYSSEIIEITPDGLLIASDETGMKEKRERRSDSQSIPSLCSKISIPNL